MSKSEKGTKRPTARRAALTLAHLPPTMPTKAASVLDGARRGSDEQVVGSE